MGLDKAARIEGIPWDGGGIDELANCKPGIWDANIRPALADRKGWCWLLGVPDMDSPAQVEYRDLYEMAQSGVDPEWEAFHWPSSDILDPAELESAKRRVDPRLFEQEFGGKFVLAGGLAFPDFDSRIHIKDEIAQYDRSIPLCWALDFNVNPMCAGVIQHRNGEVRVIDEIVLADSSTDVACTAFLERVEANGWLKAGRNPDGTSHVGNQLYIYGDPSGSARDSTSGYSDWSIVKSRLKNLSPIMKVPVSHSPLKDTVNAVRSRLMNAAGESHMFIHSNCRQLIKDLRSLLWPSDLTEGHCAAWLRYFCEREYPVKAPGLVASGTRAVVGAI